MSRDPDTFVQRMMSHDRSAVAAAADKTVHDIESEVYGGKGPPDPAVQAYLRFLKGLLKFLYKDGERQPPGCDDDLFLKMRPIVAHLVERGDLARKALEPFEEARQRLSIERGRPQPDASSGA